MTSNSCLNLPSQLDIASLSALEQNSILHFELDILNSIITNNNFGKNFDAICELAEKLLPNAIATIMLKDSNTGTLYVKAAPNVPQAGVEALACLTPGPHGGSCGNAVYHNKAQFVSNTLTDTRWDDLRQLAIDFNLKACWSMPIQNTQGEAIGSFALSSFEHREPSDFHKNILTVGSRIISILLEQEALNETSQYHSRRLALFAKALQSSHEGILITDKANKIIEVNDNFYTIFGFTSDEVIGQTPEILRSGIHSNAFYIHLWKELQAHGQFNGEIINRKKDGSTISQLVSISSIFDEDGEFSNYIAIYSDITQLKAQEKRLKFLAYHDELTSLYNKNALSEEIKTLNESATLILLDLDNLHAINSAYGFDIGDILLQAIADELVKQFYADKCFRIVSNTFALFYKGSRKASLIIQNIKEHFTRYPLYIENFHYYPTFCYGAANAQKSLYKHAEIALKIAKNRGKNTHHIYSAEHDRVHENERKNYINFNAILHQAFENHSFTPYFQGIYDNNMQKIVKYEALVRLTLNNKVVTPIEFLPHLSNLGLLSKLTRYMIDASFAIMQTKTEHFSINITEEDLDENYLQGYLFTKSKEYSIAPERVTLEMLEGVSASSKKNNLLQIKALRKSGFKIAIDDFGAEYSNFERLIDLEVDFIKIDARYIKNIDTESKSFEIVRAITFFAKNVGIDVIAEFVHSQAVQDVVASLGIEYSQGYLFSEPSIMP